MLKMGRARLHDALCPMTELGQSHLKIIEY